MQTQLLQFCNDTTKVHKKSQNLKSKHRAVKNLEIANTFSKGVNKEAK